MGVGRPANRRCCSAVAVACWETFSGNLAAVIRVTVVPYQTCMYRKSLLVNDLDTIQSEAPTVRGSSWRKLRDTAPPDPPPLYTVLRVAGVDN